MRILFISNLYPPHDLGGMEQICEEIVERMSARGHVCHVLTSCYGTNSDPSSDAGVTRELYLEADVYHYRPQDFFLRRPQREYANYRTLRKALDSFLPEVVFICGMWNLSPRLACWAERWMPGRVAYNIASYWLLDPDPHTSYWSSANNGVLSRVVFWPISRLALGMLKVERYPPRPQLEHVSCCSQYMVDVLTEAGAIPAGAEPILNGIDPTPFTANQRQLREPIGPLRLLYFGGLMEHKGVHTAIEALGILKQRDQIDGLQLTIVGGGHHGYEARLRSLTESLNLGDHVAFVGRVPRSEIPTILKDQDVFLFTSIWAEPFGRTIIEAMAAGLAVIGSDVGGSREIFEAYPGETLFPAGDAGALANQIQYFLDNPAEVEHLGRAGQALVIERFTLERMVNDVETWLEGTVLG